MAALTNTIPEKTIERLSEYRRTLLASHKQGITHIFSHVLAGIHGITAVQVRRDLMLIGFSSDTKKGYDVQVLIEYISKILDSPSQMNIAVLGNTRWNRYGNLDRTVFFKDRVVFISTYHAKRDSQAILDFDRAYIRAFGALPSLYSYRGYDAALIFCPAMYNDIEYDMEGRSYTPLQTTYVFGQGEQRDNHVNRNWTRVNYNSDFTITIE